MAMNPELFPAFSSGWGTDWTSSSYELYSYLITENAKSRASRPPSKSLKKLIIEVR